MLVEINLKAAEELSLLLHKLEIRDEEFSEDLELFWSNLTERIIDESM